ncbi:HPr family phosphocarrier protein [Limisalsivibrio acetivorans]|uniref:HPr family phosphocarrier protein n=1 Tax=Limisalsivibrio acetivorans TaxID=1304888 RepID=UPI0003B46045|nr:HPr family phosphocarrier protein [Limisalsivibrio acetivorans]
MSEGNRSIEIINELGLHARAAAGFVKVAEKFSSEIKVKKDGVEVNGKSIMGLMMLAAQKGTSIEVIAAGEDAEEALDAICGLVSDKFGEEK